MPSGDVLIVPAAGPWPMDVSNSEGIIDRTVPLVGCSCKVAIECDLGLLSENVCRRWGDVAVEVEVEVDMVV